MDEGDIQSMIDKPRQITVLRLLDVMSLNELERVKSFLKNLKVLVVKDKPIDDRTAAVVFKTLQPIARKRHASSSYDSLIFSIAAYLNTLPAVTVKDAVVR